MISDPTILAAINSGDKEMLLLADIGWPTGNVYVHSRVGEKFWDNRKWIGVGQFGSIEPAATGTQLGDLMMMLQTIDLAIVNEAVSDNAVGSDVKIYLGCMDEHHRIIAAELLIYRFIGRVSTKTDVVKTVQLSLMGARARFRAAKSYLRYSAKSWRKLYPGDSYCDDVEALASGPLNSYEGSNKVGVGIGRGERGGSARGPRR